MNTTSESSSSLVQERRSYVALLGRQPDISLAELEQVFDDVTPFGDVAATFEHTRTPDIQRLGGTTKAGEVVAEFEAKDWARLSRNIVSHYIDRLQNFDGKVTIGISVYGQDVQPREVQRTGLMMKSGLKKHGVSVRLIPNDGPALSTATSHHNKLGLSDNKVELLIVYSKRTVLVAESIGTQNITALATRDQGRPKRDAFVGMLPPKLALMMINLSGATASQSTSRSATSSDNSKSVVQPESETRRETLSTDESGRKGDLDRSTILDPFCGTGVLLQEAALLGFDVYGSDLAEKMVDYSKANMEWLGKKHHLGAVKVEAGDAVEHTWNIDGPLAAVVSETYLGQPFSAPPAPDKLDKVRRVVDTIVDSFLKNLAGQIDTGTPLCLAVPAWRDGSGRFTHLPVILHLESLGYEWQQLKNVDTKRLIYYREDQIVARQLLLLKRK